MFTRFRRATSWVGAVSLYNSHRFDEFVEKAEVHELKFGLTYYGRALKANGYRWSGNLKRARAEFVNLQSAISELAKAKSDEIYISLYSAATIAYIDHNDQKYTELAETAKNIKASLLVRKNLPLD